MSSVFLHWAELKWFCFVVDRKPTQDTIARLQTIAVQGLLALIAEPVTVGCDGFLCIVCGWVCVV
jgi:hypothetical protein